MSISDHDFNRLHRFYNEALQEFGSSDPRSVQWSDANNQRKRFDVITRISDLSNQSILDFGCGLGGLYKYFLENQIPVDYTGIDIMPEFVQLARQRFPNGRFIQADILDVTEPFDWVLASGAMSFKVENNKNFYQEIIKKLFSLSKKGVAFNMLDSKNHIDDKIFATYSPSEIADFCKLFSNRVEIITDYLPQDFTIYMYKD